MKDLSRRKFIVSGSSAALLLGSGQALGKAQISPVNIIGSSEGDFINSPPQASSPNHITIYAKISESDDGELVKVGWQFATDEHFENIVSEDSTMFEATQENLLSITLNQVPVGSLLYYRLITEHCSLLYQAEEVNEEILRFQHNEQVLKRTYSIYPTTEIGKNLFSLLRKNTKLTNMT